MFGGAPAAGGATSQFFSEPWSTQDAALDGWLIQVLDPSQLELLGQYDLHARTRTVTVVKYKHDNGLVTVPAPYLLKILMTDARGPYAGGGPRPPLRVGGPPGSSASSFTTAAAPSAYGRPVASPMQQQRVPASPPSVAAVPAPPWVRTAWACHWQKAELIRTLSRALPAGSLDAIGTLSALQQHAACLTLLLSEQCHTDPAAFFKHWQSRVQALGPVAGPGAPSQSAPPTVPKVALVHLGLSTGMEWMAAVAALEHLTENGMRVALGDRIACPLTGLTLGTLLEQLRANDKSGDTPITCVSVEQLLPELEKHSAAWAAAQTPVLVCIVMPAPGSSSASNFPAPGFHSHPGADFWLYMKAAKQVAARVAHTTVALMTPNYLGAADEQFLTDVLGPSTVLHIQDVRIPQASWHLRVTPPLRRPCTLQRAAEAGGYAVDHLHPELRKAWDGSGDYAARLPTLVTLESFLDAVEDGTEVCESLQRLAAMAQRMGPSSSSGVPMLLKRTDLVRIFGIESLPWFQFFDATLPCAGWINRSTGLVSQQHTAEAVFCGAGRYCQACGSLYQALVETPCFCALSEVWSQMLATQLPRTEGVVHSADLSRVPEHDCRMSCGL